MIVVNKFHKIKINSKMKLFSFLSIIITTIILTFLNIIVNSTKLPSCNLSKSYFNLFPSFNSDICGLPISKSYLYSKYNMILIADQLSNNIQINDNNNNNNQEISIIVKGCIPNENLWKDTISVINPIKEWSIEECDLTEINFWVRIISKSTIRRGIIHKIKGKCQWEIKFPIIESGEHKIEIVNTWLHGSLDPANAISTEWKNVYIEADRYYIPEVLLRGSLIMSCQDRCSTLDYCTSYTYYGKGLKNCYLFTNNTYKLKNKIIGIPDGLTSSDLTPTSGLRKNEPFAPHLGGKGIVGKMTTSKHYDECRSFAHVYNSPQLINITIVSSLLSSTLTTKSNNKKDLNLIYGGYWKKVDIDLNKCSKNSIDELSEMSKSSIILKEQKIQSTNQLIQKMYHKTTELVYYKILDYDKNSNNNNININNNNKSLQLSIPFYSWSPPLSWIGDEKPVTTRPWQLNPECSLIVGPIPNDAKFSDGSKLVKLTFGIKYSEGYTWIDFNLKNKFIFYTLNDIRKCFIRKNITHIYFGGDSVIGGISTMIKWLIGAEKLSSNNWYVSGLKHTISSDKASLNYELPLQFQNIPCKINSPKECIVKLRQLQNGIVIVNFHIQHIIWGFTIKQIEQFTITFFKLLSQNKSPLKVQPIFLNGMAIHGFREPYCTLHRSQIVSQIIESYAKLNGWIIIDAFNMTLLRPELSTDGMHFNDDMNYMMSQMIFNSVCN